MGAPLGCRHAPCTALGTACSECWPSPTPAARLACFLPRALPGPPADGFCIGRLPGRGVAPPSPSLRSFQWREQCKKCGTEKGEYTAETITETLVGEGEPTDKAAVGGKEGEGFQGRQSRTSPPIPPHHASLCSGQAHRAKQDGAHGAGPSFRGPGPLSVIQALPWPWGSCQGSAAEGT